MKSFTFCSVAMCAVLVLSACGGGGNGKGPRTMMPPPPAEETRPTAAEVIDLIGDIGLAADRLDMTDLVVTPRSRLLRNLRADSSCRGTSCSFTSDNISVIVTAGGLSDLSGSSVTVDAALHGVNHGQVSGTQTLDTVTVDFRAYGGWLDEQFFGVTRGTWSGTFSGQSLNGLETLYGFSTGNESGSNPMSGSATWTGLMVGLHRDRPTEPVTGRTQATYSFANQTMDVQMTSLTRGHADMSWENLGVQNGAFSAGSDSNSISGSFYGRAHEEVGGVFERNSLIGAFGARR